MSMRERAESLAGKFKLTSLPFHFPTNCDNSCQRE